MNHKQTTINTYNKSARPLAEYFRGIGSRNKDIDIATKLAGRVNPKVLEIGCGDGRDAKEIIKKTNDYIGFDISEKLIEMARHDVPDTKFEVADAISYEYPHNLDVVFAFASLLHLNKQDIKLVLKKVHTALKSGGIFYISLKHSDVYREEIKNDQFGSRMFYFYNPELIKELAGPGYKVVSSSSDFKSANKTKWFEIALQKL